MSRKCNIVSIHWDTVLDYWYWRGGQMDRIGKTVSCWASIACWCAIKTLFSWTYHAHRAAYICYCLICKCCENIVDISLDGSLDMWDLCCLLSGKHCRLLKNWCCQQRFYRELTNFFDFYIKLIELCLLFCLKRSHHI